MKRNLKSPFQRAPIHKHNWLLTLGDLLTLLLCFFLSFLIFQSPSAQGNNSNIEKYQIVSQESADLPSAPIFSMQSGIGVAIQRDEVRPQALAFSIAFTAREMESGVGNAWDALKKAANTDAYMLDRIEFRACGNLDSAVSKLQFRRLADLAISLERRILDAAWAPAGLKMELAQRVCNENEHISSKRKLSRTAKAEFLVFGRLIERESLKEKDNGIERRRA